MRILIALLLAAAAYPQGRTISDAEVERVHRSALLIDSHNDVPMRTLNGFDIGPRASTGQTDLARLREGGVGAVFFSVYVAAGYANGNHSANRALQMIDTVRHDIIGRYPDDFVPALTAGDIEAAHRQGKIAALMGLEGGHAIEDSLRLLRDFYRLGIRYMTLTHANTNGWADSSGDMDNPKVEHHNGLTDLGKQVVREMNRLGMIVDISHVSDKAFYDALAVTTRPVIASHSSCRAISEFPRNMTDDMFRAMAKNGGVVGINFGGGFLNQKEADNDMRNINAIGSAEPNLTGKALDDYHAEMHMKNDWAHPRKSMASLDDVVAHIDHVVKIAGIDHVGIGSDFDGISDSPQGLEDESKMPALTAALLKRGYSEPDIKKIMGGNFLRVMREVVGK
jgi:membrane dipeptidase